MTKDASFLTTAKSVTKNEIKGVVESARNLPETERQIVYNDFASEWCRRGYPMNLYEQFSDGMAEGAAARFGWADSPPTWYHGGPAGLKEGDVLRCFPDVQSPRRSPVDNLRARMGLENWRHRYVFFSYDRELASKYASYHPEGQVYCVEPEGKIQIDPHVFCLAGILQNDPEFDTSGAKMLCMVMDASPGWRAPSARIVGPA